MNSNRVREHFHQMANAYRVITECTRWPAGGHVEVRENAHLIRAEYVTMLSEELFLTLSEGNEAECFGH